eukprot:scaffold34595_cov160-Amphora_coffeaeformis.AAC.12
MRLRHRFHAGLAVLVLLASIRIVRWSIQCSNNIRWQPQPEEKVEIAGAKVNQNRSSTSRSGNYNNLNDSAKAISVKDHTSSLSTSHSESSNCSFYRFEHVHLTKDTPVNITASHAFFHQALGEVLDPHNDCQVIVGRNAIYESRIMLYPIQTYPKPLQERWYINPGFYFTTETTDNQKLGTVKLWAKAWKRSFHATNLFTVFDWDDPEHIKMKIAVNQYASRAGRLHVNINEPPCLAAKMLAREGLIPWTAQLHSKTVLIIHPFVDSMKSNLPRLDQIWKEARNFGIDPDQCFPRSTKLKFIRPPMHHHSENKTDPRRPPWMDVLADLKNQIQAAGHFDFALLGCGGFGMPLVHYIASLPHKPSAMYIGGALQLFFGILGGRWTTPEGKSTLNPYHNNNAWTWPLQSDIGDSTVGEIEKQAYTKPNAIH